MDVFPQNTENKLLVKRLFMNAYNTYLSSLPIFFSFTPEKTVRNVNRQAQNES